MAKTTAPLLSFGASGALADTMVFSSWRGVPYVRRHVVPANPQTTAQQTTRTTFALLREMWKLAPQLARDPWELFASGRPFTGMNSFVGENLRVLRGDPDFTDFIGSPGARSGIPATTIVASSPGPGAIDVDFTNPTPPAGWSITSAVAMTFPDQDPSGIFSGVIEAGEDSVSQAQVQFTGLGAGDHVAAGWLKWAKPDGSTAYSVSVSDIVTVT